MMHPLHGEWQKPCEACDGEGWIERGDMPLHHLHSEAPEYGKSDCGECGGEGWNWCDDDVSLAECPIGLFLHGDTLALKTEYGNNEGRIDAYIVSSGEFFWGHQPQSVANQRQQMVRPVQIDNLTGALAQAVSDLRTVGDDYPGSSCQKWCHERANAALKIARGHLHAD